MPWQELQTELIRLTAFLGPKERVSEPTWWRDLVGAEPATRVLRPILGSLRETGPLGQPGLVLNVQQNRVDWFLIPKTEEGAPPETRWAGPVGETLEFFDNLMVRWLAGCPPLVRLALGVTVHELMHDRVSAYRRLAEYLPSVVIDPENSSDFAYQINRPRQSSTDRVRRAG